VINPVAVLGPLLGPDASTSIELVSGSFEARCPGTPKVAYGLVDVRDIATSSARDEGARAAGERFLGIGEDFRWISEMAGWLRDALPNRAKEDPQARLPSPLVRLASLFAARCAS